jgi:SulP family sulfate permease
MATMAPGVALLFRYDRAHWRHDALAALVVALVLIPSAIAYADLARCAPAAGLFAAVVGMVAFALFTSSRHVVVGPDAAIALLVGAAIGPLALKDPGKAVTLAAVLALLSAAVLPGIMLGVVLSLLGVLADIVRPHDALLGVVAGSSTLHDVGDDEAARTIPGLVVYRFYGPVIFANVRFFIERIESFIEQEETPVRQVILDARAIPSIDITAAEQLADYGKTLRERGIELVVVKAHLPLRETLQAIGGVVDNCPQYGQLHDALADFKARHANSRQP